MVMCDNEFETMENKIWTKDEIEPQLKFCSFLHERWYLCFPGVVILINRKNIKSILEIFCHALSVAA